MNAKLIEESKIKLLVEAGRLRDLLSHEGKREGPGEFPGEFKPEFPKMGDDEDENALEVSLYETNIGLTKDLEIKLSQVEAALKRIENGTYGQCRFGDEIEEKRLRAIPEADTCLRHSK